MVEKAARAVAVVGVGAILPDAPNADAYWENLTAGRYSISEVTKDRWDPELYYDPDPRAPDKTYSTIGGWVRDAAWSPLEWRLPIPPKVSDAMDRTQKWSISASREALMDYGYPNRPLDADRTAVILGNAMAGDMHYLTSMRAYFPEYADELTSAPSFLTLPADVREAIVSEFHSGIGRRFPNITEDTMPGELGNIIAGRVANLYNFHGPNFVVDAACASALAAIDAAVEGLENGDYDAVLTGGIDANMGVPSFIKFCKIGALSATGTRPYHDGADGFVMGEGAAVMLLKRLADAERDGDHIYAVIRGLGGSSDGKGKGITAPNPVGQEFAVARAWKNAGIAPDECHLHRGPRHVDQGRRRRRGGGAVASVRRPWLEAGLDSPRLRQVEHRSPEELGGRRRDGQGDQGARREAHPAEPGRHRAEPQRRFLALTALHQQGAGGVEDRAGTSALGRRRARSASAGPTSMSCSRSTSRDGFR